MKKKLLTGIIAALGLSLSVASCGDESSSISTGKGTGQIRLNVQLDGKIITASGSPESRANEDVHVTVTDLKLKLTSSDGSISQEWESVNDFDQNATFKTGDYTLEAYYGNADDAEGYSKPHFHGEQEITVRYDQTTDVALSASMKNCRVKVRYTDAFTDYMTSYKAQILTSKGKVIDMPGDETSPAYVAAGPVTVNLTFTRPDGKNATIEAAKFDAKAKTEHVVTMDITGGDSGDDAILKINFDDTVDLVNKEVNLSDDLFDAPAPELTPEGWEAGQTFLHIENTAAPEQIKANIIAAGKIESVILRTSSHSLYDAGWPEEIDLAAATPAEQTLLTSLGLKAMGVWKNPDQMAVIDFTDVFPHLGVSGGIEESIHTFSLQVKDTFDKLSEVLEFTVKSGLGMIEIKWANAEIGRKTINAEVTYNGTANLAEVKFTKRNLNGAWDDLTPSNIQPVTGKPGTYTLTLTAPKAIETSLPLRAEFGSAISELDFDIKTPAFELIASPNDAFAHRAIVTVKCDDADDALVARNLTFTLNGESWDDYRVSGADIIFTELDPAVSYTVEGASFNHSATSTFETEAEAHIPGCDHKGSAHKVSFPTSSWHGAKVKDNSTYQYLWTVDGWETLNKLTTSTAGNSGTTDYAYKATSGTIPANGRSTYSSHSDGFFGTGRNADGHTAGKADLHNDKQHSGNNAALIRTVGWGSGNAAAAGSTDNIGFGGLAKCEHMTPGELFLGAYDNGAQYGLDCTSRPSELQFWYRYQVVTVNNNDYGTAEITVLDAVGDTIATGSKKLTETTRDLSGEDNGYSHESIKLTYKKGAPKAAKLSIIFRSTTPNDLYKKEHDGQDNPALKENQTFWTTPGGSNRSGGEYVGSELYIDDVQLIY